MNNSDKGIHTTKDTTADPQTTHEIAIAVPAVAKEVASQQESQEIERAREVGAPIEAGQPLVGGGGRSRRLLLICLDGATPNLAMGSWRGELRTLNMLAEHGVWGRVRGSMPWTSLPARLCMVSGQDPGQLGIYGPRRRISHTSNQHIAVDSRAIHEPRLWDLVGATGKHVGVVAAPATTPAPAVRGYLIGDALPEHPRPSTYPTLLAEQVLAWLEDASLLQTTPADDPLGQIIREAYLRTEQHFLLARRLLARDSYDCFVLADDGIATVQHALWHTLDTTHPRYAPAHPYTGSIGSFYRFVDEQIGELLEVADNDMIVAVVSSHGTESLRGQVALNEWLLTTGDLVLHAAPDGPVDLEQCAVDWEQTRAWAGDNGAIYLNVAGRAPGSALPADQATLFSLGLTERLRALHTPEGEPALEIHRPATLYTATNGIAPDLLAICTQPGWQPTATLGYGKTLIEARSTPLSAACDSPDGFFVLYDPRNLGGGRQLNEATIYDIVPTLLSLLDQPGPRRLRGSVIPAL